jgi:sec-independent protein translocase protein TatA
MSHGLLAFLSLPGGGEWLVILFLGLLIFGRRLPEVARSLGQSLAEFKRGLADSTEERRQAPPPSRTSPSESTPPLPPQDAHRPPAPEEHKGP